MRIKYKIIIFTYLIIILTVNTLGFIFYSTSQKYIINKASTSNLNIVKQINASINTLQTDLYDISTYIATNQEIISLLQRNSVITNTNNNNLSKMDLTNKIMNLIISKEYISLFALYSDGLDSSPYYICTDLSSNLNSYMNIKSNLIYHNIYSKNGAPYWFYNEKQSTYILGNNKHSKIILGRLIKNPNDYTSLGTLFLGINEDVFKNIYIDNIQSINDESIVIVDDHNSVLSKYGDINILDNDFSSKNFYNDSCNNKDGFIIDKVNNKDMLIAYSSDNQYNWKIFYSIDTNSLTQEIKQNKVFIYIIVLICMFISFPLILLITHYITTPLKNLLESMKNLKKGNFTEQVKVTNNDEIGQLSVVYNEMVIEIKELIEENYVLEIKEREAELNALHSQINPHFLYNTLDTIYWKAQGNNQKEIGDMIYSLSKLFRLSLNRGENFITISKEKELLEHYLLLQRIRFKDKLIYEILIDDSILNYVIPKFILQPFIENAIVHGLEPKEGTGNILIEGQHLDNNLYFTIQDNGIGIETNKLNNLVNYINEPNKNGKLGGYAINNISERLRLHFQNNYSLKFTSNINKGTKIEIIIPIVN
jgi:two-component system sensor histidine kinase YesM